MSEETPAQRTAARNGRSPRRQGRLSGRLLHDLAASHQALIEQHHAPGPVSMGMRAVLDAVAAAIDGIPDAALLAAPATDAWSMAEVVEHLIEHDQQYFEIEQHGVEHYVEHGLEHALQLWTLRRDQVERLRSARSNAASGTLE